MRTADPPTSSDPDDTGPAAPADRTRPAPDDRQTFGDGADPNARLEPLPFAIREDTPQQSFDRMLDAVLARIDNHPRSLQVEVGPSEIGTPCERQLGHKLLRTAQRKQTVPWKPTVGTALHTWMETVFADANRSERDAMAGHDRYYIEPRLTIGTVAGHVLAGHSDLYDRLTAINWDHKFVGPTKLRTVRRSGPGATYRVQAHTYGLGWENAGLPVRHVGIVFWPRDSELNDRYVWSEPYDRQIAIDALIRLGSIATLTDRLGATALDLLARVDDFCEWCPFYAPRIDSSDSGCPGPPGGVAGYRRSSTTKGDKPPAPTRIEDLV